MIRGLKRVIAAPVDADLWRSQAGILARGVRGHDPFHCGVHLGDHATGILGLMASSAPYDDVLDIRLRARCPITRARRIGH